MVTQPRSPLLVPSLVLQKENLSSDGVACIMSAVKATVSTLRGVHDDTNEEDQHLQVSCLGGLISKLEW